MTVREGPIERPELERYSNTPIFNTKAVVQQTGVPAPTLRAWERRYTLLSPERTDNDYRLYSERDIIMIRWLKERVDKGMAISQAIALFRYKNTEAHLANGLQSSQKTSAAPGSLTATYSMHKTRERLLEAFNMLDEPMANMIMASMLAIYPVEQVCTELISPTMWQIGQLWTEGELTVPIEHFASNFFRGLLTNLFHITSPATSGPLVIVCSAPGEQHELAPLMLSLFLRRNGARVAYLGQSIESEGLLQVVKRLTPVLICVSLTMSAYLSALIDIGYQLQSLPPPRPIFAFGGRVFDHHPDVLPQVPGTYLTGDLTAVVTQLQNMILERIENRN